MSLLRLQRDAALRVSERRYAEFLHALSSGASPEECWAKVRALRAASVLLKQLDDAVREAA